MKQLIQSHLKKIINKKYPHFHGEIALEYPPDAKMGDLAFPCFELAKIAKKSPNAVALELAPEHAPEQIKHIKEAKAQGPYLNLFLNKELFWKELFSKNDSHASRDSNASCIMIEFSSPNTNKPLHLGHVRNNCLGSSLSNLLESRGNKITRASLVNDRGVHICKSIFAYQQVENGKWKMPCLPAGRENACPPSSSLGSEVGRGKSKKGDHIVGDYYVLYSQKEKDNPGLKDEIQDLLKKWEQGDKEVLALWKKLNTMVLRGLDETYKRLGIKFDKTYFESKEYKKGKKIILDALKKKKCYQRKDGAVEINLEKYGLDKKVLVRPDGTSVYITQDIGLAVNRQKDLKLDKIIYVVGNEQEYHFKVLFKTLELFGFKWAKNLYHLSYAMVNLTTGKLKSREGKTVDADDLMEQMHQLAKSEIKKREPKLKPSELKKRAEVIGLGAMKFYLLKHSPTQTITYNPLDSIAFEGATGPYVQYTYARIQSIIKKSKKQSLDKARDRENKKSNGQWSMVNCQLLNTAEEWNVGKLLARYPEVIMESANEHNPSKLATHLIDLAQSFNTFYHKHKVLGAKNKDLENARLALISKVAQTLKYGLNLLGIDVVDRM